MSRWHNFHNNFSDKLTRVPGANGDDNLMSKYNEAGFQILRIHLLWSRNTKYFFSNDFNKMLLTLNRIWLELCADANKKNSNYALEMLRLYKIAEDSIEDYRKKRKELEEFKNIWNHDPEKRKAMEEGLRQSRYNIIAKIQGVEIFLKNLQNDVGKGSAYKDDATKMF